MITWMTSQVFSFPNSQSNHRAITASRLASTLDTLLSISLINPPETGLLTSSRGIGDAQVSRPLLRHGCDSLALDFSMGFCNAATFSSLSMNFELGAISFALHIGADKVGSKTAPLNTVWELPTLTVSLSHLHSYRGNNLLSLCYNDTTLSIKFALVAYILIQLSCYL